MGEILAAAAIGLVFGAVVVFLLKRGGGASEITVHSSIESMRKVGELVVFRLKTKEIVTAADHELGAVGKKYLSWLISEKKMAMIFEFGIDFKFNLQSPEFEIREEAPDQYTLVMPDCYYTTNILDISFYDEQESKLLPALLPDLINRAFGSGFDESDRNKLKEAAREEANRLAESMVEAVRSDVQQSAKQTLEAIATGFGATQIHIEFPSRSPVLAKIELSEHAAQQVTGEAG